MDTPTDGQWQTIDDDGQAFLESALAELSHDDLAPERPDGISDLAELISAAATAGASDLHLSADLVPHVRVKSELRPLAGAPPLSGPQLSAMLLDALTDNQRRVLDQRGDLDTVFTVGSPRAGAGRARASIFRQSGTLAAAIRLIPTRIVPLDELGLPASIARFADLSSGLVLVTGPTGSGKSTTLAALIEHINTTRSAHIVTVEDPVEYRYTSKSSLIQQRAVGPDTESYPRALRSVLRQDPDVILVGEMRDLDTIRVALTAAETGHLVFATLHSADATSAVNRIIDVFPGDQQGQIRSQLALSLEGSVSQRLLRSTNGDLLAATEVVVATAAVRNLIRSDKVHQLRSVLETGSESGMHTFDQSLARQVKTGRLDASTAHEAAIDATALNAMLGS